MPSGNNKQRDECCYMSGGGGGGGLFLWHALKCLSLLSGNRINEHISSVIKKRARVYITTSSLRNIIVGV